MVHDILPESPDGSGANFRETNNIVVLDTGFFPCRSRSCKDRFLEVQFRIVSFLVSEKMSMF